jgi:hypothetical protein
MPSKTLSAREREQLLATLEERFEENMKRHKGVDWASLQKKLESNPKALWSLSEMERTGGEPDVVGYEKKTGQYTFYDCCAESPDGRRSLCYDQEALASRKEHKPRSSAIAMATAMGIDLLSAEQYRAMQQLGAFDEKTSSWVLTPARVRTLGGALFCDRRFDTVFVYHSGADSYYAARGFRGVLQV